VAAVDLILTGDLVLDEPRPDHWLGGIAPATRAADLTIGHLEVPHTANGAETTEDVPAPGADPAHLSALQRAGFAAVTLAGNHMADCGAEGIADTRAELRRLGIAFCGAGASLREAREPARLQCRGRRIALLSYNCVGPEAAWATADRAGVAYVRIDTADGAPITPSAQLETAAPESLQAMQRDIARLVAERDFVIVALHKGLVHTPSRLAPYERAVAHAAIDAGADVIVSHHAHLIRGMEFHRGKPIFHGLGNGCVVTRALGTAQDHAARAAWAQKRKQLFGFEPDPQYWLAPFHPEAVNAMLGRIRWHEDGAIDAGFIPVHVEPPGRPVLADAAQSLRISEYIARFTLAAGLPPLSFQVRQDMVVAA
jgi:poly-gamma-glutamate capsule biosynthesis protein CapA/YwtB (metallophosphatase superfamily)